MLLVRVCVAPHVLADVEEVAGLHVLMIVLVLAIMFVTVVKVAVQHVVIVAQVAAKVLVAAVATLAQVAAKVFVEMIVLALVLLIVLTIVQEWHMDKFDFFKISVII